jgi:hypothetical protein
MWALDSSANLQISYKALFAKLRPHKNDCILIQKIKCLKNLGLCRKMAPNEEFTNEDGLFGV